MLVVLALVVALQVPDDMSSSPSGVLPTRPPAERTSPVQALVDATPTGGTVDVPPGTYVGEIVVDRALHVRGQGRPTLVGVGDDSVVRITADGVVFEGFVIDGRGTGSLDHDASGIHVWAKHVTVRDCEIRATLFGIYLREADEATVERCRIVGIRDKAPGEKGSGVHVWNTQGFHLADNVVADVRDGFYIQSSSHGEIRRNEARDLRYGLHYMFSDDNVFEDNLFENGAAGTAVMNSKHIVFKRNRFLHNRGFASVGLLLKTCDDVLAEDNLIADNARGIFLEGSYHNTLRGNVIAQSDAGVVLYASADDNTFEANAFIGNLTPLLLVGKRTDARFDGNYWSDNDEPDLDGDGITDRPYRLMNVFDHLRGNLAAADLMASSVAALALAAAERAFPVLEPVHVEDATPLARPPADRHVPSATMGPPRANRAGLGASAAVATVSLLTMWTGRRRRPTGVHA
ncbi:MAG: nitrous oxide reductase family maturation protein NosD [Vicinamibacterales bacterium]